MNLSDFTFQNKYSHIIKAENRKETWQETVNRNKLHNLKILELKAPWVLNDTQFMDNFNEAYSYILDKKILPSMRSMQFAGKAAELNEMRVYNCSYRPINTVEAFSEILLLLLSGVGTGYSVQQHHIKQLPRIKKLSTEKKYLINDSIQGWAESVQVLMEAYLKGTYKPRFDFRDIREKGTELITTGGKAPGSEPLKLALFLIEDILAKKKVGSRLTSLECHDILCYLADAVLAGGIRRSAMISLFSYWDKDMLNCKSGEWWLTNPARSRSNNSAVLLRNNTTWQKIQSIFLKRYRRVNKKIFDKMFDACHNSFAGEPGFFITNNLEIGTNPCFTGETSLLTEYGLMPIESLKDTTNLKLINVRNEVVDGKVWSNGIKDVIKLKFSNGEIISCTPNHLFKTNKLQELEAKDLLGERILPLMKLHHTYDKRYVQYGFIQGDGALTRLNSKDHLGLEVNIGDKDDDILKIFDIKQVKENQRTFYVNGFNNDLKDLCFSAETLPYRVLPQTINAWTDEEKLSFLTGLYSANGCVIKGHRVAFKSTCRQLIDELQELLLEFNIESYVTTNKSKSVKFSNGDYVCKESYDLNISQWESIREFANKINFIQTYKRFNLTALIMKNAPKVISITNDGQKEVFDFSLNDDTHWGVVGNSKLIAHNCGEVALYWDQFCNLCDINGASIVDQDDANKRAYYATLIATVQSLHTDFHYLNQNWIDQTEKERLIGIGVTGICGMTSNIDKRQMADKVLEANEYYSKLLRIPLAARTTVVKPAGTTSCVLECSSGIHSYHSDYYIRRVRLSSNDPMVPYLIDKVPDLIESEANKTDSYVVSFPMKAPNGAITRNNETALDVLTRVYDWNINYIRKGHRSGDNYNNVSCTINVRDDEWEDVRKSMWDNIDVWTGISLLPFDGGSYVQAPFEEIAESEYNRLMTYIKSRPKVNFSEITYLEDNTDYDLACSGGICDIKMPEIEIKINLEGIE